MQVNDRNMREINDFALPLSVVGLTGGVASGKTVATDALRAAGFNVVDADEVSRTLTAPGTDAEKALCAMFPEAADGNTLNRRKLRTIITADGKAKRRLEEYIHPLINGVILTGLQRGKPTVLSAPLLYESGLSRRCDAVVCLVCPRRERIKRLTSRDGVTEKDAEALIDAQLHDTVRATLADFCVPSDIPRPDFEREIVDLFTKLLKYSR